MKEIEEKVALRIMPIKRSATFAKSKAAKSEFAKKITACISCVNS